MYFPFTGDIVQLGNQTVFRFNYPQEAAQMRLENQVSQHPCAVCIHPGGGGGGGVGQGQYVMWLECPYHTLLVKECIISAIKIVGLA